MKITLINTTIATTDGLFSIKPITLLEAQDLINEHGLYQSAVGHEATAIILTELLSTEVDVNRINFEQEEDDIALVFKLKSRVKEGLVLTRPEIEKIGYEFKLMKKINLDKLQKYMLIDAPSEVKPISITKYDRVEFIRTMDLINSL